MSSVFLFTACGVFQYVQRQMMMSYEYAGFRRGYSLLEALAELGRPAVVLGFGGKFSLLVTEMRANDINLHEGPEALCLPFQVVGRHHWMIKAAAVKGEWTEKKRAHCTVRPFDLPFTLILCSPLGCGKMSTHMITSPTASTPAAVKDTNRKWLRLCACVQNVAQLRYMTKRSDA